MTNVVVFDKTDGSIHMVEPPDTQFPKGVREPYDYGLYDVSDGAENISECAIAPYEDRVQIINSIFKATENDQARLMRIMDAVDANAAFIAALDSKNWAIARMRVDVAYSKGQIEAEDRALILQRIPAA